MKGVAAACRLDESLLSDACGAPMCGADAFRCVRESEAKAWRGMQADKLLGLWGGLS